MSNSHFCASDVYKIVSKIPKGRVSTYGAVAKALKAKGASRAVGQILKVNPTPIKIPCHRVVRTDGSIGGYGGSSGSNKKTRLLRSEGLSIRDGKIQNMERVALREF